MFVKVKRVIGATTIMLESGQRVRLIGVNTPETKHPKKQVEAFGKEASEFIRKMVEGKLVRIELVSCLRSSMNKLVSMASIYGEENCDAYWTSDPCVDTEQRGTCNLGAVGAPAQDDTCWLNERVSSWHVRLAKQTRWWLRRCTSLNNALENGAVGLSKNAGTDCSMNHALALRASLAMPRSSMWSH